MVHVIAEPYVVLNGISAVKAARSITPMKMRTRAQSARLNNVSIGSWRRSVTVMPHLRPTSCLGLVLLSAPLLAGVIWASPAAADANSFIRDMHRDGIHAVSGGDASLLQAGLNLCQQLSWGAPPSQLEGLALQRSDDRQGAGGLTPQQAEDVVDLAWRDLCPTA